MFEKARVERILYSSARIRGNEVDKSEQFKDWNSNLYNTYLEKFLDNVEDFYSDFELDDFQKEKLAEKLLQRFLNRIPDNSLIAKIINQNTFFGDNDDFVICYPFFSSHVMLPIKPGEVVWAYKYDKEEDEKDSKISTYDDEPKIQKLYWLSRVHGESFNEDLNYTHHDRAFIPTILEEIDNELRIPDFQDEESSLDSSDKSTEDIIENEFVNKRDFYLGPVIKSQKKPGDFIIQGSNNNTISLSGKEKNHGEITLVSGKGQNVNKAENSTEAILFVSDVTDKNDKVIPNNSQISIRNAISSINYYETLKYPHFYEESLIENNLVKDFSEYKYKENLSEGSLSYVYDSSILKVTGYLDKNISSTLFNSEFLNIQGKHLTSSEELVLSEPIPKVSFDITDKKYYTIQSQVSSSFDAFFRYEKPAIVAKSNDIFLVARKENELFQHPGGNISLIKDSDEYDNYAHLILGSDGVISMDGPKIVIGTLNRNKDLSPGEGNLVLLGESSEMEPLVKGENLKAALEHLIVQIKQGFTIVSEIADILSSHKHDTSYGPTTRVHDQSLFSERSGMMSPEEEIQKQLTSISDNLSNILSKIVRTS